LLASNSLCLTFSSGNLTGKIPITMKDIFEPLSEDELDWLDGFLVYRIDEDADCEGKDEGALNISELDGLLTAIVSGPVTVPPSQWLPQIWGDFPPAWKDETSMRMTIAISRRLRICERRLRPTSGISTPTGWRVDQTMHHRRQPYEVSQKSGVMIPALAAAARNLKSAACIDWQATSVLKKGEFKSKSLWNVTCPGRGRHTYPVALTPLKFLPVR
jgi:hypothetical protein